MSLFLLYYIHLFYFLFYFLFFYFSFLDSTYKWEITVCFPLTYFTKHNTIQVYPCGWKWQISLFFNRILFHCTYIHWGTYLFKSMFSFSSDNYSGVELLIIWLSCFKIFWGIFKPFLQWPHQFTLPRFKSESWPVQTGPDAFFPLGK